MPHRQHPRPPRRPWTSICPFDEGGNDRLRPTAQPRPLLIYHARVSGTYHPRLRLRPRPADVKLTGAKRDIYRLSLTTGPFARAHLARQIQRAENLDLLNLCASLRSQSRSRCHQTPLHQDFS